MINGSIFHLPLADKSVHCIVLSPPYWGLRDYGLAPIVISGELDCVHKWSSEREARATNNTAHKGKVIQKEGYINPFRAGASYIDQPLPQGGGSFCLNCSAWRGSLGLEPTPELFIEHCRIYARECWRVLRDDGTMWVNIGGSYAASGRGGGGSGVHDKDVGRSITIANQRRAPAKGYKQKDLVPTPWLFAIALQQDGWYLRSDIIWQKPNPMPESVTDRPTRSHEYVFLFSKSRRYFYDADAVRESQTGNTHSRGYGDGGAKARAAERQGRHKDWAEKTRAIIVPGGRNLRSVWTIPTHGFDKAHFATFPPRLIEPMIKAGTSERGVCIKCGSQFERVVNKEQITDNHWSDKSGQHRANVPGQEVSSTSVFRTHKYNINHTLGFRPTCRHYDHLPHDRTDPNWTVPLNWPTGKAIVLDPFGGAGTTELVAAQLGRRGVSVELSPEYCRMGRERIADDMLPMLELIERKQVLQQASLFAPDNGKISP